MSDSRLEQKNTRQGLFLCFQRFVSLFDSLRLFGAEALQQAEQLLGVESVELIFGPVARLTEWPVDDNDGHRRCESLERADEVGAGTLRHFGVHDDSVHCREAPEHGKRLVGAIGGEDVELRGLDDKLAGGNASRVFAINHQKARAMRK